MVPPPYISEFSVVVPFSGVLLLQPTNEPASFSQGLVWCTSGAVSLTGEGQGIEYQNQHRHNIRVGDWVAEVASLVG